MPRRARVVYPETPHLLRAIAQEPLFDHPDACDEYLRLCGLYASVHGVDIESYCLMKNHVHMVATPQTFQSLARFFRSVHSRYAGETSGPPRQIWRDRFQSTALDRPNAHRAIRMIEQRPTHLGIAPDPWEYPWSSAAARCGRASPLGGISFDDSVGSSHESVEEWLREREPREVRERFEKHLDHGSPCGDQEFVKRLERNAQRRARRRESG